MRTSSSRTCRTRARSSLLSLPLIAALLGGCLVEVGPADEAGEGQRRAAANISGGTAGTSNQAADPNASAQCGVTYYVQANAIAGGNGGKSSPFRRIGDALAAAASPKLCGVTIKLADGTYFEDLSVSKHTTVLGASRTGTVIRGRISNTTAAQLTLEKLTIANAGAPGAVVVSNPAAVTTIRNVSIDRAARHGVRQTGGTLKLIYSTITYTYAGWDDVHQGAAVYVDGGATARLSTVVTRGGSQGLVVAGTGTRARATSLQVHDCQHNFWFRHLLSAGSVSRGFAAVEARNGGLIYARWLDLYDNEVHGLSVHHGARGYVYRGRFLRTRAVRVDGSDWGGINATVRHGGSELQLVECEAGHGELAGVQVYDAYLTQRDGMIHHNPIGMHVQAPADLDWDCLYLGSTIFTANDRDLDSMTMPVPDAMDSLDDVFSPPPEPVCRTVSW
jgi:hypothetical protein